MKIGIISDTHDLLRPEVIEHLRGSDCVLDGEVISSQKIFNHFDLFDSVMLVCRSRKRRFKRRTYNGGEFYSPLSIRKGDVSLGRYTPDVSKKIMSSIKSKDTEPELMLRRALWHKGLRFRVNVKSIVGKPDVVFPKAKIAVFCDGDFWHGHNWAVRGLPSFEKELEGYSNYWKEKISQNVERDNRVNEQLKKDGWYVLRFWESDIRRSLDQCIQKVETTYRYRINHINCNQVNNDSDLGGNR